MPARQTRRCKACKRQFQPRRRWDRHCGQRCRSGFLVPVPGGKETSGAVTTYVDGPLRFLQEHRRATNDRDVPARRMLLGPDEAEAYRREHHPTWDEHVVDVVDAERERVLDLLATPAQHDLLAAIGE